MTASRNPEKTRGALLDAAETLFAERGFAGATIDAISDGAGVNRALVSYYFGSKEGLYDTVIARLVTQTLDRLAPAVDPSTDQSPQDLLRAYVIRLGEAFAAVPAFPAILMREYLGGAVQKREGPAREVLRFFEMTKGIFDRGRASGAFRDLDPHVLHLAIVGPLVHFLIARNFRDATIGKVVRGVSNPPLDAFAADLADIVLSGVVSGPPRAEAKPRRGKPACIN